MNYKYNYTIAAFLLLTVGLTSCEKSGLSVTGSSSLTIVNVVAGGDSLVTNFDASTSNAKESSFGYSTADVLLPYSSQEFSGLSGTVLLALSPVSDTLVPQFQETLTIASGGIYSLFLTGTPAVPASVFVQDQVPVIPATDSAIGIRFVHLSTGVNPVNIVVEVNSGDSSLASNLAYKATSPFILLPASAAISSYTFKIEDAATAAVLATYTLGSISSLYFKSVTLALYTTTAGGMGTLLVNNY